MTAKSNNQQEHVGARRQRRPMRPRRKCATMVLIPIAAMTLMLRPTPPVSHARGVEEGRPFTSEFRLDSCGFSTIGRNPYFILIPGHQLVLEGQEDGELSRVEITVLEDIEPIHLDDLGTVRTRVVEEREWADGELVEVSRNFFAICCRTLAVYYFGEDVDIYEGGQIVGHEGAWRAGEDAAMPGLMMPGTFLLGSRYYQEFAPDVAMDRGENVAMGLTIETPAGVFEDCVEVLETTALDPEEEGTKIYCPGVGLVVDEELELVNCGFVF